MDSTSLLAKYDRPAPRYTSYPTALELDPSFDVTRYTQKLEGERARGRPISLYAHVPFCRMACAYCGCSRIIAPKSDRATSYLERITKEIAMQGALVGPARPVMQLSLGGGTPTFLDDAQLERLITAMERAFSFDPRADRSIEIDPRTVDRPRVLNLARMGFNRISLGVQDFDPRVQGLIRRLQPAALVREVFDAAREAAIASINFDLIYGLPGQTASTFENTLDLVLGMRPDRIAVFGYAHLPSKFPMQRTFDPSELPSPALRLALAQMATARLVGAGYVHIGLDHFALPGDGLARAHADGTMHRDFQGYSTHASTDTIACGPTAIGRVGRIYVQNAREIADYNAAIDAGRLAIDRGMELDDDDVARAEIIEALLCYGHVDIASVEARHGFELWPLFQDALAPMAADGLVKIGAHDLTVTPLGRPFARVVCTAFDRYRGPKVHARSI